MRLALIQLNLIVGDVDNNIKRGIEQIRTADKQQVDAIVLTELFTTGYPPRDLLYRKDLIAKNLEARDQLVAITSELNAHLIFGYVEPNPENGAKPLFNSVCVAYKGEVKQVRHKTLLPNYDVFEEDIYFEPGKDFTLTIDINNEKVGVVICEEAWNDKEFWKDRIYPLDPVDGMVFAGAKGIISINASPFRQGIVKIRRDMIHSYCVRHNIWFAYCNQVGYNDDVGFDGTSFVMDQRGEIIGQAYSFTEDWIVVDTNKDKPLPEISLNPDWQSELIRALICGVRDYFGKLNMEGPAIVGLSGGIDSALVAWIAVQALGPNRVIGIGMPSEFSSSGSVSDAEKIAKKLGIHFAVQPIRNPHDEIRSAVDSINHWLFENAERPDKLFGKSPIDCKDSGVTDENLQARIRGIYLMAVSNYFGGLVLSTGNKSEMAVGYCTMYGDMCGGLAVISDVKKTTVFELCKFINQLFRDEIIPWDTITKPPSAELRANQKDEDSLPPYALLDRVMEMNVEQNMSCKEIKDTITEDEAVDYLQKTNKSIHADIERVCTLITRNQFKRNQAPTGLKVTPRLFKMGYRMPIVHRWL